MKLIQFSINCLKALWYWIDQVLRVVLQPFGYPPDELTLYAIFIYCGFVMQCYDTCDTHYHEWVTNYEASIEVTDIQSPVVLLKFPVQDLLDTEFKPVSVAEIFNNTPSAGELIGKCGVHNRTGYGEIPVCDPKEQFTVKKFLEKDLLVYTVELNNLTTLFQGYHIYNGGIPPYLWEITFSDIMKEFLEHAAKINTVKVYVNLFMTYIDSFGQGLTEPYGMTEMRWDDFNKVLVNSKFSVTYKIRHVTRLEWPMDSDCRDYPGSSRGKCMSDCNHLAAKGMRHEDEIKDGDYLPLNFRLFEHDKMFEAINKFVTDVCQDYKRDDMNRILSKIHEQCRHQCQRKECAQRLIEPTVLAATGSDFSGVRLYAPNKPVIWVLQEEKMTGGQMIVGVLSIGSFWFPELHVFDFFRMSWPLIMGFLSVMLARLTDRLVKFGQRYLNRRVAPADAWPRNFGNVQILNREGEIFMIAGADMNIVHHLRVEDGLSDSDSDY
ncbi:hypothetical protein HDE_04198 [Halotydeus destructor]|nr:hypothetical protein HDE_04198 [Halotydeus destructor]